MDEATGSTPVSSIEVFMSDSKEQIWDSETQHHIWCNFFTRPRKDCEMCKGLYEKYPMDVPPDELVKKHFPNVVARSDTSWSAVKMNPVLVPDSPTQVTLNNGDEKEGVVSQITYEGFFIGEEYVRFENVRSVLILRETLQDFVRRKEAVAMGRLNIGSETMKIVRH
jgi:hypothetical protein